MRRMLRLFSSVMGLWSVCIAVIVAQPAANRTFEFFAADDCALPCWHGIVPGETSAEAALTILESDPWVDLVEQTEVRSQPTFIFWRWSASYPFSPTFANANLEISDGLIGFSTQGAQRGLTVGNINLNAGLKLSEVWIALGPPQAFTIGRLVDQSGGILLNTTLYNFGGYAIAANVYQSCPLGRETMWASEMTIQMAPQVANAIRLPPDYGDTLVRLLDRYDRLFC